MAWHFHFLSRNRFFILQWIQPSISDFQYPHQLLEIFQFSLRTLPVSWSPSLQAFVTEILFGLLDTLCGFYLIASSATAVADAGVDKKQWRGQQHWLCILSYLLYTSRLSSRVPSRITGDLFLDHPLTSPSFLRYFYFYLSIPSFLFVVFVVSHHHSLHIYFDLFSLQFDFYLFSPQFHCISSLPSVYIRKSGFDHRLRWQAWD
jgi:hypothetical protein